MLISLLVTILIAEHSYWVFDRALGALSRSVWTTGEIDVRKEEYSMRRIYLQKLRLSGGQVEKRGERASQDNPIGFWGKKNVDVAVADGREILSRGWEKKKIQ